MRVDNDPAAIEDARDRADDQRLHDRDRDEHHNWLEGKAQDQDHDPWAPNPIDLEDWHPPFNRRTRWGNK